MEALCFLDMNINSTLPCSDWYDKWCYSLHACYLTLAYIHCGAFFFHIFACFMYMNIDSLLYKPIFQPEWAA